MSANKQFLMNNTEIELFVIGKFAHNGRFNYFSLCHNEAGDNVSKTEYVRRLGDKWQNNNS